MGQISWQVFPKDALPVWVALARIHPVACTELRYQTGAGPRACLTASATVTPGRTGHPPAPATPRITVLLIANSQPSIKRVAVCRNALGGVLGGRCGRGRVTLVGTKQSRISDEGSLSCIGVTRSNKNDHTQERIPLWELVWWHRAAR